MLRFSGLNLLISRLYRAKSMTRPSPIAPPASPVPAPRGITETPACAAAWMMELAWVAFFGKATASGTIW